MTNPPPGLPPLPIFDTCHYRGAPMSAPPCGCFRRNESIAKCAHCSERLCKWCARRFDAVTVCSTHSFQYVARQREELADRVRTAATPAELTGLLAEPHIVECDALREAWTRLAGRVPHSQEFELVNAEGRRGTILPFDGARFHDVGKWSEQSRGPLWESRHGVLDHEGWLYKECRGVRYGNRAGPQAAWMKVPSGKPFVLTKRNLGRGELLGYPKGGACLMRQAEDSALVSAVVDILARASSLAPR